MLDKLQEAISEGKVTIVLRTPLPIQARREIQSWMTDNPSTHAVAVRLAWRNFGIFLAIGSIAVLAYSGSQSIWHGLLAFVFSYFLLSKWGDRSFLVFITEHAAKDDELLSYLYENQLAGFRSTFGRTYDLESCSTW